MAKGLPIGMSNCPCCGRIARYPQDFNYDTVCTRCCDEADSFTGRRWVREKVEAVRERWKRKYG